MASAQVASSRTPFLIITVLSALLLQGWLITNGAFAAMFIATFKGHWENGHKLHRVYTGIPMIDWTLAVSVSFWDPIIVELEATRLESAMLCASLQALATWASIERMRRGEKHVVLQWLPFYMFALQYFGTAIFLPFYFYLDLDHHFSGGVSDPSVGYLQAKSLLPAVALAFLNCYRMVFFPPSSITQPMHQAYIAFYQLGPFACYAIVAAVSSLDSIKGQQPPRQTKHADAWWIKTTYAVLGLFSGVAHIVIFAYATTSSDASLSLSRLFVPKIDKTWGSKAAEMRYAEEHLFFLQWDFILIVLACALYATRTLEGMYCRRAEGWTSVQGGALVLVTGIACTIVSPGAVVSLILYLREDILRANYDREQNVPAKKRSGVSTAT
ncbi:hypothetical protein BU23DRAFT_525733 [Bimuria novae-zelandiae CBS 107.79]|uniref:Uncharacterized protein n=1 Tax=Bimuria novae-zelandiae CBS 107.79 TaxID=1447943 RepID=A0A6A5VNJ3_9PLEO|nr:hypothetical protein BU23DRAFT_525733 [Bimuria novae-zelandiae CBS 107.79]